MPRASRSCTSLVRASRAGGTVAAWHDAGRRRALPTRVGSRQQRACPPTTLFAWRWGGAGAEFYRGELLPADMHLVPQPEEPPSQDFLQQLREYTAWRLPVERVYKSF